MVNVWNRDGKRIWAIVILAAMLLAACSAPASSPGGIEAGSSSSGQGNSMPTAEQAGQPTLEPPEQPTSEPTSDQSGQQVSPTNTPQTLTRPTETKTPAAASGSDNGQFSLSNANSVPPKDVITEMAVSVEGLGEGNCFDLNSQVFLANTDLDLMEAVFVKTCGWQAGETVSFTVTDPKGKTESKQLKAKEVNGVNQVDARFQPRLGDPAGTYQFEVKGDSGSAAYQVNYHKPKGPHLYIVSKDRFAPLIDTQEKSYSLKFYGFEPGEKVRLVAYKKSGTNGATDNMSAVGWQDYTMDDNGSLTIQSGDKGLAYLALGEKSGEVHLFTLKRSDGSLWDWFGVSKDYYCAGALPTRVKDELTLKVNDPGGAGVVMRDQPNDSANSIVTVANGTDMQINQGPKCGSGAFWWNVFEPSGNQGWVPESVQGQYVLDPVKQ